MCVCVCVREGGGEREVKGEFTLGDRFWGPLMLSPMAPEVISVTQARTQTPEWCLRIVKVCLCVCGCVCVGGHELWGVCVCTSVLHIGSMQDIKLF